MHYEQDLPDEERPGYATRWLGLAFTGISLIVISLDNTILNVALPAISRSLGATAAELQWIVDAYVLVFAALLLTMGSVGDRIGRKKLLLFGLAMFGVGSLVAALSTDTLMLIASRAFLGVGGATIMPSTLSMVSATFPDRERPQAIAIWAGVFALGVGIGPVAGGFLVENFTWNAVFLVNLPVIAVALIGGWLYLGESRDIAASPPDIPGVILSIIGLFALIFAIIEAGVYGWTAGNVLLAFGIAAAFLTAFAVWEARYPNAMLPLYFFRNMSFTGANIALVLVTFSLFGAVFFLSQYFQTVQGAPAFEAGLRILPLAITLTFTATQSAKVSARIGTKYTVALGVAIAGTSLFLMSQIFRVETPYTLIVIPMVTLAIGMGLTFSPATNSIMGSVPVRQAGIGSAMNDTTRQLGGALGIAVLGTIMNNIYLRQIEPLTMDTALPEAARSAIANSIQAAHGIAADLPEQVGATIIATTNEAFVNGMTSAILVGAVVMWLASLSVLVILPAQVRRSVDPHETIRVPSNSPMFSGD